MLVTLGWDDDLATAFSGLEATHQPARVTRVDRVAVDLVLPAADLAPARARLSGVGTAPVVGDWVAVAPVGDSWRIDTVLPRRSSIERATASGRSEAQVLAANIDTVLVTVPVVPEPKAGLVERLVALSWDSGATPVVVITKSDLTPDASAVAADLADAAPGVDVICVSIATVDGLVELVPYLGAGATLCLLGKSGAGKSSLVNALTRSAALVTGGVRRDGKGRHTTTHRELVVLPTGAVVIDTPGLRGAGLWVTEDGLDRAFVDVEQLEADCRFGDCGHDTEPGCAVLAAIEDGRLSPRRLASWRKLQREARWMATRHDARLRAEARRAWVITQKEVRRSGRIRP